MLKKFELCPPGYIFVFGSNLAGRHGKGAALEAKLKHGAVVGYGEGHHGNSYAIPTKGYTIQPRTLESIQESVFEFIEYARRNPAMNFFVTRIGCGLAGFKDEQIAPMFRNAPDNCKLPKGWK
jgi:hypothetical protein